MKDVAVTRALSTSGVYVLAWFDTVPEAERFIARRKKIDPEGVRAGHYGIDTGCLKTE